MTYFNAFAPNYSASADPLAGFHGPNSKGREGRGGKGREGRRGGREMCGFFRADLSTLSTAHALVG